MITVDERKLREVLDAVEKMRSGLLQMRENAEQYGEAWASAYVKEYQSLLPGSAEEQFRALNTMQMRMSDFADGVVEGYDVIQTLRSMLEQKPSDLRFLAAQEANAKSDRMTLAAKGCGDCFPQDCEWPDCLKKGKS